MPKVTREEFDALVARVAALETEVVGKIEAQRDPLPEDNAEAGYLAAHGWSLDDVNAYIATLNATQRKQADLPREELGTVYFVTDTTVARAREQGLEGLADLLEHLQGHMPFTTEGDPGIYLEIAGRYEKDAHGNFGLMVAPWPNTRVFRKGVTDDQVLGYVKARVEGNANTNPDAKYPG